MPKLHLRHVINSEMPVPDIFGLSPKAADQETAALAR